MKKIFTFLVLLCFFLSISIQASAHPGKTNSFGGHIDHSTGNYHYHHGYSAHEHYDMNGDGIIDCPYDFDDQTGVSSGTASGRTSYSNIPGSNDTASKIVTIYEDREVVKEVPIIPNWVKILLGIFLFVSIFIFILFLSKKKHILELEHALSNTELLRKQSELNIQHVLSQFNVDAVNHIGESYLYRICGAPPGEFIGDDGLPSSYYRFEHKWGEKYTFYIAGERFSSTRKIHRSTCRYGKYQNPINAYTINRFSHAYEPCYFCKPDIPDTEWVDKYIKYKNFFGKYNVTIEEGFDMNDVDYDPYMANVTQNMLEDYALEMGVSLQTALFIINQKRKLYGIHELNNNQFDI